MFQRKLLLSILFCAALNATAQEHKFKPLQIDLNIAGVGVKTTYHLSQKLELDAGLGYGLSAIGSIHRMNYVKPAKTERGGDGWLPDIYHSPYLKLGILYQFAASSSPKPSIGYTKLQYTGWLPATNLSSREDPTLSYQHRLALKAGFRKALNKRQTRSINLEAGAALCANYNLSFISAGPQFNINFISDLFTGR